MSGHRALQRAEQAAIAPGIAHRCRRCGREASGPFPADWDHVSVGRERYAAHCAACLKALGCGETV